MLCGSLDGRGVWGRMNTCICMAESLICSTETITTMRISYTPIQNKKLKSHRRASSILCPPLCEDKQKSVSATRRGFSAEPSPVCAPMADLQPWEPRNKLLLTSHPVCSVWSQQTELRHPQSGKYLPSDPLQTRFADPWLKIAIIGTSLVVQWLRLQASIAGGMGLIPGWGTKIPHAMQCSQTNK